LTYLEQFQNNVDVIEYRGGSIGDNPGILEALADANGTDAVVLPATELAKL
jgi:hypothetical protein